MTSIEFRVSCLHCGGCESAVRSGIFEIEGVSSVEVNAATGRLVVEVASEVAPHDVVAKVADVGYEAVRA